MELIYSMRRKPLKCEPPHFESPTDKEVIRPICTISTANIIAFSSPTELNDAEGDTWGGHVYVCDLDTPWDSHKVTSTTYPVSTLEWDIEGRHLLVGTTEGEVSVFTQKDYLLNSWNCLYTYNFPGEHIIKATFFHNGRRIVALDKKPDAPITERLQVTRSTPTLKGFGGVPIDGAVVVTAHGVVGALVARDAGALTASDALRHARARLLSASLAHKNGNIFIAAWCVSSGTAYVRCSVCTVRGARNAPASLTLQPLPALPLVDNTAVSLSWCLREDADSLLIAGSKLTLWKLTERSHPVHKLLSKGPLQGSTTPGGGQKPATDCFNTVVWQQTAAWTIEGGVATQIVSSKCPLSGHAVLATPRHLHLLARDTHHYLCSRPVITSGGGASPPPTAGTPPKKPKYGAGALPAGSPSAIVSCVELSQLGGVLVCVDSHAQLHVYRTLQPWVDIPSGLSVQHATSVLEYGTVAGYDCLDILLTLKHNIVEAVYERVTENFQRQLPAFQQFYFHSWLKLRMALCRLHPNMQVSASWLTSLLSCRAAAAALPAADHCDLAPADDHDNKLQLQPAEAGEAALQRAAHVALTALAARLHATNHNHYELLSDPSAVSLLRKLAACARSHALVRVLARLAAPAVSAASAASTAPAKGSDLMEECAVLTAQQSSPRVWESLPRCCVSYPNGRQWPLYFEYGVEPENLRVSPEPPIFAQADTINPSTHMDAIRYMYLGGGWQPARWRQCARCGVRSLRAPRAPRALHAAHDDRFLLACRCGGKWTLVSNV
ncbi:mediator of RNA polymerase II transcription subunit 16 [Plodia interpunctella]|uniref:mediator of RNA polymerase II transcription subunit 16 n=1 Tax=Plodia interpunctella TaxID=58824 RepID=UPI002368D234|nr:mediator of RNA polymerase II transcription subunit 16 [Plodia interpunctella]XP_053621468.1 mediator of RNA polymerase II transcription subunit 16 [Plodia interpunctella]